MIKGYTDNFNGYSAYNRPFDLVATTETMPGQPNGNTVRFPLVWPDFQGWDGNGNLLPPNFGAMGPLWYQLARTGLKALPVILASPFDAAHPGDGYGTTFGGFTYPTGANNKARLGDFAVEVLKWFHPYIDAVEIWNEPTKPQDKYTIPNSSEFVGMCQSAASAVYDANQAGAFGGGGGKIVVSGGMYMNGQWEGYWDAVVQGAKALCTYQLGIHPYPYYIDAQRPTSRQSYIDKVLQETLGRYDTARQRAIQAGVSNSIWLTEVGTTSQSPWGQDGQNDAIKQVIDGLKARDGVGACIIYRLYQDNVMEPEFRDDGGPSFLYRVGVCDTGVPNGAPKLAYTGISNRWLGW